MKSYFSGARQEFKSIHWPNFSETRRLTLTVITISLVVAALLGLFDYIFSYGLGRIVLPI